MFFFGPKIMRCITFHHSLVGVLLFHLDEMQVYRKLPPTPSPASSQTHNLWKPAIIQQSAETQLNSSTERTMVRGVPDCAITTTKKMNYPEPATKLFDMHEPFSLLKSPTGSVTFFYQSIFKMLSLIYLFINPFNDVFVFNLFAIWSQL